MRFVLGSSGSHTRIVASRGFSGVKNHIGVVHDLIDAAIAEFICEGESNTDCHRKALLPHQKWLVSSYHAKKPDARDGAAGMATVGCQQEFLASIAPLNVVGTHVVLQPTRLLTKHSIAAHMAE